MIPAEHVAYISLERPLEQNLEAAQQHMHARLPVCRSGLDSVIGTVVGGLIVGVVENLAAGYLDPYVGGGTKDFAPYVLMIAALMIRPYGIFGSRRIERI